MAAIADNESPDWLTTGEVARRLRVDERTVRSHAADLGAIHVGRQLRFPAELLMPMWRTSARGPHPVTGRLR